ncbi:SDR family oxidoreductase [Desulfuromonas sp. TF]|uniref:SDR family oxidoreductase n=1 Tax=Desulfuromonas sp. TF TaxID=1232410 RepID=UPI0004277E43|nr:SDR family oxidoreductase [Desulfuromonas sp. TF]
MPDVQLSEISRPVLVAGATGYIGGRLVPRLLEAGHRVRAVVRTPAKLDDRPWSHHPALEVVRGDLLDRESMMEAARGCRAAYYLVHSMQSQVSDFADTDRRAARNMADAAAAGGVERIIYLSGLGEEDNGLSRHLRSRTEVARILGEGPVPVTVFRAAMIIGSGSASFEILRYLMDRLPVMITPRWVSTLCQPIGVRNVLHYLIACLDVPETIGQTFDIGQEEVITYRRLMEIYAEEAGLPRRLIIPVPFLTPRLSSYWIHLVTPLPAALARPLAEGLSNPVVCRDFRIRELIPQQLLDCREAIRRAMDRMRQQQVETSWTDSGLVPQAEWSISGDPGWAGGTIYDDSRRVVLRASPEEIWPAVAGIGGSTGWYYADWLWVLRGKIDRVAGGVGLRRGRRSKLEIRPGDALDFWRVVQVQRPTRLLLAAEMKLPGQAVLAFHLNRTDQGTELLQIARFMPRGLFGILYWYAVYPFHNYVFNGMLRGIAASVGATVVTGPERLRPAD